MKKHIKHQIDIDVSAEMDTELLAKIKSWSAFILEQIYQENICLSINIASVGMITSLNKNYRNKNKATNVLSFPDAWPEAIAQEKQILFIGDIVICPEVLQQEAKNQNKILAHHWCHMLVHGILHLSGYDHIKDGDAQKMEQREIDILAKLNINNPYLENS